MTPVLIRGITYRSIADAARALGVHYTTVVKHLDAGTPDLIGLQRPTGPRPCEFDGIKYPSLKAASVALGITVEAIRQRLVQREKQQRKLAA